MLLIDSNFWIASLVNSYPAINGHALQVVS